jgi:hypothetical protein
MSQRPNLLRGLKQEIHEPIANDIKDAYWAYRAARARYPGADGVLNFTPYLGLATAAEDIAHGFLNSPSSYVTSDDFAKDAIELALNRAVFSKYGRGLFAAAKKLASFAKSSGQKVRKESKGRKAGARAEAGTLGAGSLILGPAATIPPLAYYNHYANRQREANAQYGNTPLNEIADELRSGFGRSVLKP